MIAEKFLLEKGATLRKYKKDQSRNGYQEY
jgi:hypothetical protein